MASINNSSKSGEETRRNQPLKMSIKKMNSGSHKEWNSSEPEESTLDSPPQTGNEAKEVDMETENEPNEPQVEEEEPEEKEIDYDELHWDEKGIKNEENRYCYCKGGRTEDPMLKCGSCGQWFHQACLKNAPRRIYHGEWRFTKFTCANCSSNGEEVIDFEPVTWKEASTLALVNLIFDKRDSGRIYYAPKEVSDYIGRHWEAFCRGKKRTTTWWSTISSSMTTGAKWFMRPPKEQEHLYTVRDFPNVFPEFVDFFPKISKLEGTALSTSSSQTSKKKKKRSSSSGSRRSGSRKRKSRNADEENEDDDSVLPPTKQRRRTGIQWLGESKETLSSGDVYYKAFTKDGQVFKLLDYVEIEAEPGDHPRVVRIIDLLEKDGVKVMSAQHLYTKEDVESLDGKSHKHKDPRELFLSFQTAYYTLSSIRRKCYVRFVSRNQLKGIRRNARNDASTRELRKWLSVPGHYYLAAGFNISKKKLFYLNEIAVEKFNLKTIDSSDESYPASSSNSGRLERKSSRVVGDESDSGSEPEDRREREGDDGESSNKDDEEPEIIQEEEKEERSNEEEEEEQQQQQQDEKREQEENGEKEQKDERELEKTDDIQMEKEVTSKSEEKSDCEPKDVVQTETKQVSKNTPEPTESGNDVEQPLQKEETEKKEDNNTNASIENTSSKQENGNANTASELPTKPDNVIDETKSNNGDQQ